MALNSGRRRSTEQAPLDGTNTNPTHCVGTHRPSSSDFKGGQQFWERMLYQFLLYRAKNGAEALPPTPTAHSSQDHKLLHSWIQQQRRHVRQYKDGERSHMTSERLSVLEHVEFPLALRGDEFWKANYEKLREYHATTGHCRVPHNFQPNRKLAVFVTDQRRQHRLRLEGKTSQMTDERKAKLDALNFEFSVRERVGWDQRLDDQEQGQGKGYKVDPKDRAKYAEAAKATRQAMEKARPDVVKKGIGFPVPSNVLRMICVGAQVETAERAKRPCNIPFHLDDSQTYIYDAVTGNLFVMFSTDRKSIGKTGYRTGFIEIPGHEGVFIGSASPTVDVKKPRTNMGFARRWRVTYNYHLKGPKAAPGEKRKDIKISAHQLGKIVAGYYEFHSQSPFMGATIEYLKTKGIIGKESAESLEDAFPVMGKANTKRMESCQTNIPIKEQSSIADADHGLYLSFLWHSAPPCIFITSHSTNIRFETIRDSYRHPDFATGDRNFMNLFFPYADPILERAFGQYCMYGVQK